MTLSPVYQNFIANNHYATQTFRTNNFDGQRQNSDLNPLIKPEKERRSYEKEMSILAGLTLFAASIGGVVDKADFKKLDVKNKSKQIVGAVTFAAVATVIMSGFIKLWSAADGAREESEYSKDPIEREVNKKKAEKLECAETFSLSSAITGIFAYYKAAENFKNLSSKAKVGRVAGAIGATLATATAITAGLHFGFKALEKAGNKKQNENQ